MRLIVYDVERARFLQDELAQQREKRRLEREERRKQREAESNQAEVERQKAREERRKRREFGKELISFTLSRQNKNCGNC